MSLLPFLFLSIRTYRASTPSLEQACKRTAQHCAAIMHARSADDSVHCPDDQINQEPIMNEMIDGYRVLAQDEETLSLRKNP